MRCLGLIFVILAAITLVGVAVTNQHPPQPAPEIMVDEGTHAKLFYAAFLREVNEGNGVYPFLVEDKGVAVSKLEKLLRQQIFDHRDIQPELTTKALNADDEPRDLRPFIS